MKSLRTWCLAGIMPNIGEVLHLEEIDDNGSPTGRRLRVRVEVTPYGIQEHRSGSTQRMHALNVPREPPHLCRCGHVRVLHNAFCSLCGIEKCSRFFLKDPEAE